MALDESREDDEVFKESGITYAVNKQLFEQVKPINIDFVNTPRGSGYRISANLAKECGSCSC
jgi:Fe-S cluster assembly iron-binding protein IscA